MDNYERLSVIGKGSFGTVSKIRRKSDGRVFVWKELNYGHMCEKEKQLVVSEVNILRELRHPFIVKYYDRVIDKPSTKIYIVMEYCEGGDLGRVIRKCKRNGTYLDEDVIWKIATQITLALKECHRHKEGKTLKPILHRDIKPGNILLDQHYNVKLADFGLAKELGSKSKFARTNVGTPFYMSPEMMNSSCYNEKSDIWAVGCLLYELAALRPPFEASSHLSLAMKINTGTFSRIPSRYSDDLFKLIRTMLSSNQSLRPSVEDVEVWPQIRRYARDAQLAVRETQLNQNYAVKMRSLRQREEELARRSQELESKAAKLRDIEARLAARSKAVAAAEARLAAAGMPVSAAHSTTASSRRPSSAGVVPPPLPTAGVSVKVKAALAPATAAAVNVPASKAATKAKLRSAGAGCGAGAGSATATGTSGSTRHKSVRGLSHHLKQPKPQSFAQRARPRPLHHGLVR